MNANKKQKLEHEWKYNDPIGALTNNDVPEFKRMIESKKWNEIYPIYSLLLEAMSYDAIDIVKYIVNETNINIDKPPPYKHPAVHEALIGNHGKIARFLINSGANMSYSRTYLSDFTISIVCGDLQEVKKYCERNEQFVKALVYAGRFLVCAAESGWLHIVQFLCEKCNIKPSCYCAQYAVRKAAGRDRIRIVQWMVSVFKYPLTDLYIYTNANKKTLRWLLTRSGYVVDSNTLPCDCRAVLCTLTVDRRLILNRMNIGNTCCEIIGKSMWHSVYNIIGKSKWNTVYKTQEIDLRDNQRIGKEGVDALVRGLKNMIVSAPLFVG